MGRFLWGSPQPAALAYHIFYLLLYRKFYQMQTFKTSKSRENILSKIRKGLKEHPLPIPYPDVEKELKKEVFTHDANSPEEQFAAAFIQLGGKFVYCDNEQIFLDNMATLCESRAWSKVLCSDRHALQLFQNNKFTAIQLADPAIENADACITDCETLVARTGSVFLSSKQFMGRTASVFYPVHIIIAYAGQVVNDIEDALDGLKKKYGDKLPSMINLNTGPSRTADIEKTLVVGVHGPGEVFCFYINA